LSNYLGLNAAQVRRLAKRRLLLNSSGTATAALALEVRLERDRRRRPHTRFPLGAVSGADVYC
jgi:hypothetical protein